MAKRPAYVRWPAGVAVCLLAALGFSRFGPFAPKNRPESNARPLLEFAGPTMGTHYTVKVIAALDPSGRDQLRQAIHESVDSIDRMMSTWKPDSELSRFNRHADTSPFPVSPEMIQIFQDARAVSEASRGAFDVTVGPIVNAWGFGPEKKSSPPPDEEIAGLLERVGFEMIEIDVESSTLRKTRPDLYCDLSGIAQGFAADKTAEMLESMGYQDYMVDISGEFRAKGLNASGEPWQIAIELPDAPERTAKLVVPLSDRALATSGDYRNYFEKDGTRFSHEIDPITGRPIGHKLASASVIMDRCSLADAYATALMVLGPDKGLELAARLHLPAFLLVRNDAGGFDSLETPEFATIINSKE